VSSIAARIGQVIRANRERRSLSQEALAVLANVDRSYLGEIERGTAVPSIETLQKLADGLGEKLSILIGQYERDES
jgi:XRE family transcriptional regulator, regulator of sulfur utilization